MTAEEIEKKMDELSKLLKKEEAIKKKIASIKADIDIELLNMRNEHNLNYIRITTDKGTASMYNRAKLSINNISRLKRLIGRDVVNSNVKEIKSLDYKGNDDINTAITTYITEEYTCDTIPDLLLKHNLSCRLNDVLKGDVIKDFQELKKHLGDGDEAWRTAIEIQRAKNYEIMTKFFDKDKLSDEDYKGKLLDAVSLKNNIVTTYDL